MDIALDYYRIFEAVARHRSFTRAAEALVNSQPNLTRAVHNLEAELGCRLFLRSSRGVELTPEGEALYAHVTAAMEQLRAGEAELQRQREQAQRDEAEAAAIEEGVEDEREAEREHERAAMADDETRERGRVAELRRQGLICEDSAAHAAATATACGIASGCPDDVAEAARCSAAASVREERDGGEKHKAGM